MDKLTVLHTSTYDLV